MSHERYVSYEAAPSTSNGSERLVVIPPPGADAGSPSAGDDGGANVDGGANAEAGAPASISLTDGTRPDAYPDLARGVFDTAGSFYAAWMELYALWTPRGALLAIAFCATALAPCQRAEQAREKLRAEGMDIGL